MQKRLILFLTAVIIIALPLGGCSTELPQQSVSSAASVSSGTSDTEVTEHMLRLPYDSKDSLNPYKAQTVMNTNLMPVIYDSLVRLNEKYEAEPVIAAQINNAGTVCTVALRSNIRFTNGSMLTADDVVYSYEKARSSARYRAQLENVASVSSAEGSVVFQLKTADPLFPNLLTFSVVKKDTADDALPIGSGRYIAQVEGSSAKLVYHTRHFRGVKPQQTEIPLVSMPDHEAMLSGIKSGTLSATFSDLSKGELSGAGALSVPVDLSNMVYIGFHTGHDIVSMPEVRQAVSYAINRGTMFYNGFGGRGKQTSLPIHPFIGAGQEVSQEYSLQYDADKANQLLEQAGLTKKSPAGFRLKEEKEISLNILINADNSFKSLAGTLLKDMLASVGLQAAVTAKPFAEYQADVKAGKYDLYIGEMKLLNNMSLSPLLNNTAVLAGPHSEELSAAYRAYLNGTGTYNAFMEKFSVELPFIPLIFRSGVLVYNRNIKADVIASVSDVYYNLENWK